MTLIKININIYHGHHEIILKGRKTQYNQSISSNSAVNVFYSIT